MNSRRLALVGSADLQPTLEKVQKDDVLEFAEYSMLRVGRRQALPVDEQGPCRARPGPRHAVRRRRRSAAPAEASMRMAHLLQTSCLALRRLGLEQQDKHLAREALEYQLAYMQACLRRSMASFGEF
jgi:hypothetical protein